MYIKTLSAALFIFIYMHNAGYADNVDCKNPIKTYEILECQAERLDELKSLMSIHIEEANNKFQEDEWLDAESVNKHLDASQKAWLESIDSYCSAIYEISGGTSANIAHMSCLHDAYERRIHKVWVDFIRGHPQAAYNSPLDEPKRPSIPSWLPEEPLKGVK